MYHSRDSLCYYTVSSLQWLRDMSREARAAHRLAKRGDFSGLISGITGAGDDAPAAAGSGAGGKGKAQRARRARTGN